MKINRSRLFLVLVCAGVGAFAMNSIQRAQHASSLLPDFRIKDVHYVNYRDPNRSPAAAPVSDNSKFEFWQIDKRNRLSELFDISSRPHTKQLSYRFIGGESVRNGLVRRSLVFQSIDGTLIPAVLQHLESPGPQSMAAILVLPGHTGVDESGLDQLVLDEDSYQHAAATELAKSGFVTLAFELRGFGRLGKPLNSEHRLVAYNALLEGSFYKKVVIGDAFQAFELLAQLDMVDKTRIAVAGASYGGELAVTFAALNSKVKAAYFSAYGGMVGQFRYVRGGADKQPHYCHIIPGIQDLMQREDIIFLIAPRPIFGTRGARDNPPGDEFLSRMAQAWISAGNTAGFEFKVVSGGAHEFFVNEATEFFNKALR